MKKRTWTVEQLKTAIKESKSVRSVLIKLGLIPAGGNYDAVKNCIRLLSLDISHFTGKGWKKGNHTPLVPEKPLETLLTENSVVQSYKLKKRLFRAGLRPKYCEECGWAKISPDGRLPLELDHINGNKYDNRIENLRILCPNCHSLKPTHRGKNKNKSSGGEMVYT